MGLHDDFEEAVMAVEKLDFTICTLDEINVFETTIRYLGGFLGAYDISEGKYPILLKKALEVGQMLYNAFDTPNRMPITRWNFNNAMNNFPQEAGENVLVAEIGSLTLEFTRLSQVTNDARWYDAIQRIMDMFDSEQERTKVPGLWPVVVSAKTMNLHESSGFTIGGMADSTYEYLPKVCLPAIHLFSYRSSGEFDWDNDNKVANQDQKQYVLLGGGSHQYQKLYSGALAAMKKHIFFRPMTKDGQDILHPGDVSWVEQDGESAPKIEPKAQHLSCFAGGMVALGAKVFGRLEDLSVARKLVEGCIWGYESGQLGIMPEVMHTIACDDRNDCPWDEEKWRREIEASFPEKTADEVLKDRNLPPGVSKIDDGRYILR